MIFSSMGVMLRSGLGLPRGGTVSSVRWRFQMGAASYEGLQIEHHRSAIVQHESYFIRTCCIVTGTIPYELNGTVYIRTRGATI
jgi:hypothetical protein